MSDVEKGEKEEARWVQKEDSEWELVVPSWEMPRWTSALMMLAEKPLGKMEQYRVRGLGRILEQRGRLSATQLALLRTIAERHEASIPTIPPLPIVLGHSEVAEEKTEEERKEEGAEVPAKEEEQPDKDGLWAKFSTILSENGLKPDEHRAWFDEEWALSLSELPPEQAEKMMELSAKEVVRGASPPPAPRARGVILAGPLDLLIKDFIEGNIDYTTYLLKVSELGKEGEQPKGGAQGGSERRD